MGFVSWPTRCAGNGLGQVLDMVPNHMGIERGNALWCDVLENGPASLYAQFFDIDWDPVKAELRNKVLLPILGDQYGVVLERGELQLEYQDGAFVLHYFDHLLPLAPRQYQDVLAPRAGGSWGRSSASTHPDLIELQTILTAHRAPALTTETPRRRRSRAQPGEGGASSGGWPRWSSSSPVVAEHLARERRAAQRASRRPAQLRRAGRGCWSATCSYRLAHWRVAGEEINYRRFFDINSLAAIRVEDPDVFEEAHALHLPAAGPGHGALACGSTTRTGCSTRPPTSSGFRSATSSTQARSARRRSTAGRRELARGGARRCARGGARRPRTIRARRCASALYVVVEKIQGGRGAHPRGLGGARHHRLPLRQPRHRGASWTQPRRREFTDIYEQFIGAPAATSRRCLWRRRSRSWR